MLYLSSNSLPELIRHLSIQYHINKKNDFEHTEAINNIQKPPFLRINQLNASQVQLEKNNKNVSDKELDDALIHSTSNLPKFKRVHVIYFGTKEEFFNSKSVQEEWKSQAKLQESNRQKRTQSCTQKNDISAFNISPDFSDNVHFHFFERSKEGISNMMGCFYSSKLEQVERESLEKLYGKELGSKIYDGEYSLKNSSISFESSESEDSETESLTSTAGEYLSHPKKRNKNKPLYPRVVVVWNLFKVLKFCQQEKSDTPETDPDLSYETTKQIKANDPFFQDPIATTSQNDTGEMWNAQTLETTFSLMYSSPFNNPTMGLFSQVYVKERDASRDLSYLNEYDLEEEAEQDGKFEEGYENLTSDEVLQLESDTLSTIQKQNLIICGNDIKLATGIPKMSRQLNTKKQNLTNLQDEDQLKNAHDDHESNSNTTDGNRNQTKHISINKYSFSDSEDEDEMFEFETKLANENTEYISVSHEADSTTNYNSDKCDTSDSDYERKGIPFKAREQHDENQIPLGKIISDWFVIKNDVIDI